MNKKIIFIIVFIWLLLLNFVNLYNYFIFEQINKYYDDWKYDLSYKNFSQRKDVISVFNSSNSLYKLKKYEEALKSYLSLENIDFPYKNILFYNIWNTYYRIWEQQKSNAKKYWYYEKSLGYYDKSLWEKYTKDAKDNYDFVKSKLDSINKENTQENNSNSDESESGENSKNNLQNTQFNNTNSIKTWTWDNKTQQEQQSLSWTTNNSWTTVSTGILNNKTESQSIEDRILLEQEKLKKEQEKYQEDFWKIQDPEVKTELNNVFDNIINQQTNQQETNDVNQKDW